MISEIATSIQEKYIIEKIKDVKLSRAMSNNVSKLGHPCARFLFYKRTLSPEFGAPLTDAAKLRMQAGNIHERDVIRTIEDAGYNVIATQIPVEWSEKQIRGYMDARLGLPGYDHRKGVPVEVKATNPWTFEKLTSIKDMIEGDNIYHQQWAGQILVYCLLDKAEEGLMIIKNRDTDEVRVLPVVLEDHREFADACIQRADTVNEAIAIGIEPDHLQGVNAPGVCARCELQAHCCPQCMKPEGGMVLLDDADLQDLLDEYHETKEAHRHHERVNDKLKTALKGVQGIAGRYLVEGKEISQSRVDTKLLSPEVREAATKTSTYWKLKYTIIGKEQTDE